MEKQKFKRGNLVKVLVGHLVIGGPEGATDISPEDVGREAIIDFSYAEKYGGGDVDSYSIIWLDTGASLAWKDVTELELVDEGGDHLFAQAAAAREELSRRNKDISYIAEHLYGGSLSSESILFLFDLLGFDSAFLRNGEYFDLSSEWASLHPVFLHIRDAVTVEEAELAFTVEGRAKYTVSKVWEAFHNKAA